jgi:hypothetical protein
MTGFQFPAEKMKKIPSLRYRAQSGSESTQLPIQWVPWALPWGVKRPGREADHSLPSSAEIKNAWSYISTLPYIHMAWCLVKYRDFTLSSVIQRWATGWMIGGSSPHRRWEFSSSPLRPDQLWGTPSLLLNGYQGLFRWD